MLLSTGALTLHYGDDIAWEIEYSPNGVDSGLCVGVARTAFQNEGVTLQPCGVSGQDGLDPGPRRLAGHDHHDYVPLINGSDTNFSHPFVLTYPKNGHPTDKPRPQLFVQNLTGFSHGPGTRSVPFRTTSSGALTGACSARSTPRHLRVL